MNNTVESSSNNPENSASEGPATSDLLADSLPDPLTGDAVPYLVSTEKYTKGEKCEFMEKVLMWAASLDITIDPPEQYKKMQREQEA